MNPAFLTILVPAMPLNIALAIVLFAMAYATFTLKIQRRMTNPQKTKELRAKISNLTKEMNAMAKRNENIASKQAELMPLINESMMSQMKGMFVILPVFFLVYYGLMPIIFNPISAEQFSLIGIGLGFGSLFIATCIIFGLILSISIMIRDKMASKANAQVQQQVQNTNNAK